MVTRAEYGLAYQVLCIVCEPATLALSWAEAVGEPAYSARIRCHALFFAGSAPSSVSDGTWMLCTLPHISALLGRTSSENAEVPSQATFQQEAAQSNVRAMTDGERERMGREAAERACLRRRTG